MENPHTKHIWGKSRMSSDSSTLAFHHQTSSLGAWFPRPETGIHPIGARHSAVQHCFVLLVDRVWKNCL